jgi:ATP-dependent Lon protease
MAIISLFTNRIVDRKIGITGEITLRGLAMPVGGIREKVFGAQIFGLSTVVMPEGNRQDFIRDIPDNVKKGLKFKFVENIEQVIDICFGGSDFIIDKGDNRKKTILNKL